MNIRNDFCQEGGFEGEILLADDDGELAQEYTHCHNTNQNTINVPANTSVASTVIKTTAPGLYIREPFILFIILYLLILHRQRSSTQSYHLLIYQK